jgi:hypothetical protein
MIIIVSIGIVIALLSVVVGVIYLVLVNVLSVDAVGWLQELSERIVRRAATLHLPEPHRDREEEWRSGLEPYSNRPITMLFVALRIWRNARRTGVEAQRLLDSATVDEELVDAQEAPLVALADDLAPYKLRKQWLVNGGHLALALAGRRARVETLNGDLTVTRQAARFVGDLQAAIVAMLNDCGLGLVGDVGVEMLTAVEGGEPELVGQVLHRFKRADLRPFFDELDTSVGSIVRVSVARTGRIPASIKFVFDTLQELLMDLESFQDYGLLVAGRVKLEERRDCAAMERYRNLLEGVFTEQEVSTRVAEIGAAWEGHRLVVGP